MNIEDQYQNIANNINDAQERGADIVSFIDSMRDNLENSEISSTDIHRERLDSHINMISNRLSLNNESYTIQLLTFVGYLQRYIAETYGSVNNFLRDNNITVGQTFADISEEVGYSIHWMNIEKKSLAHFQYYIDNYLEDGGTFILEDDYEFDGMAEISGKSNITIDGNGHLIHQVGYATTTIKFSGCTSITLKDLDLYGDPDSYVPQLTPAPPENEAKGVYILAVDGTNLIQNVNFYNQGTAGIWTMNGDNFTIDNCIFDSSGVDVGYGEFWNTGIRGYQSDNQNWEIKNCTFTGMVFGILPYVENNNFSIHNNIFRDIPGQHGLYVPRCSDYEVYENVFENIASVGMKWQFNEDEPSGGQNISIHDNVLTHTGAGGELGIIVGHAGAGPLPGVLWENVDICNNTVRNYGYGIRMTYCSGVNMYDNNIYDCHNAYGIQASFVSGSINNNYVENAFWSGILADVLGGEHLSIEDNNFVNTAMETNTSIPFYLRTCAFLTSNQAALDPSLPDTTCDFNRNDIEKGSATPAFGLYQHPILILNNFHDNRMPNPALDYAVSKSGNTYY